MRSPVGGETLGRGLVDAVDAAPQVASSERVQETVGVASRLSFEARLPQFRQRPQATVLSLSWCLGVLLPYRCTRRSGESYAEARLGVRGSPVARTRWSGRPVSVLHRPQESRFVDWNNGRGGRQAGRRQRVRGGPVRM